MEWGLRFRISKKLPGEAYPAGTGNLGDRCETVIMIFFSSAKTYHSIQRMI